MSQPAIHWLTTNQQLASAARDWQQLPWLTLDTEFVRTKTFWPLAGLIQLGYGEDVWLIDPLTISEWQPLRDLLLNPNITKVMHAMSEDIELFRYLLDALPENVFDTQLAAAYAGLEFSMGYQKLIARLLEIDIPKGETRSDWLARPLTPSQVDYAALDVFYLGQAYPLLREMLEDKGFTQWHREDCDNQVRNIGTDTDPREAWRDVKMAWQLRPQQLAVLQRLCEWRENEARARNLSRNRLAPAGALWDLARYQPDSLNDLRRIKAMKPQNIRQSGQEILVQIEQGQQVDPEHYPERPNGPLPKQVQPVVEAIKSFCRQRAEQLGLLPELVPSKPWVGKLLRGWLKTGSFDNSNLNNLKGGWRREEILQPLIEHLNARQFPDHLRNPSFNK
ncbi:ribonuclease D [Parendozoicomonas haliclonae]|uniref:Ribonuclease D n=1 Tax=Parendozoicomonas haliclonae TaxID=1960125 RepID=A0A1X7AMV5_9GAMM|nr:ribonuclease D [Parendozoicomonas haliclonae]SMA49343.1 Ribonuclease D [Parendozoicomonas haliclonae]